jgi:hypothetical protein
VALAEYTVNNYDLEAINTSQKGAIFSGYFKDKLVYWNEPSIYVYSVIIEKDVNFDLKITSSEYGDEIYPLLKTGWIYTEEGTNYYAENGGIKFEVVDTVDGKRLRITNLGGENKKITRVFFYPTDVGISKDNLKKVTGLEIKTLRDLYKGIESGLVCYKAQEDGSEYYYNPLKILGEAMEVD